MPKLKEPIWLDACPLRCSYVVIEETFDYGLNLCMLVYLLVATTVTCVVPFCSVRKKDPLSWQKSRLSIDSLKTPRLFLMIVIIMTVVTIS